VGFVLPIEPFSIFFTVFEFVLFALGPEYCTALVMFVPYFQYLDAVVFVGVDDDAVTVDVVEFGVHFVCPFIVGNYIIHYC
jgi:hypothetical protein